MSRRVRLIGVLWRWHRRFGLAAAALVLLLAITGIALNHTAALGLDHSHVSWTALQRLYGAAATDAPAFPVGEQWLSRSGAGLVYLDTVEVAPCRGELLGALLLEGIVYAACAQELLLITPGGELVESITASTGLPVPVTGLGLAGATPALQSGGSWFLADLERMDFSVSPPAGTAVAQQTAGELPAVLRAGIPAPLDWLTWERLLLDVHSGRIAGRPGVLLVDALGVILCSLGASGFAMWWLHRRR